ncbi:MULTISPECIES: hypothetical protein [unclassified Neisseria]|nr:MULTISPECIES: hypothetical protein [unclassified Neisseria]MBF0803734.1 hypothetical protein [Neisseria sp. 19428wB4_WF04]
MQSAIPRKHRKSLPLAAIDTTPNCAPPETATDTRPVKNHYNNHTANFSDGL